MPKKVQVTKYCCNVCGYPYENFNTAIMCENAPIIRECVVHNVGQEIMFEAEDVISNIKTSATVETGLVLAKLYLTAKNAEGFFEHHYAYVVRCRDTGGRPVEERIVVWGDDLVYENLKRLYSPPQFRYNEGYHLNMPKYLNILDHVMKS